MRPILVTGGTGTLGRVVVDRLLEAGRPVRVASRGLRPEGEPLLYDWVTVDYGTGEGLDKAMDGVDAVVHCIAGMRGDVDDTLLGAARKAGVPHFLYISIVGVDRVPLRYYRAKLAAERLIEESGLPWTVLRATQFHDLIRLLMAASARLPVMFVPAIDDQPVDVREVGERLAVLALGPPAGRAPDLGGPQVRSMADLARAYLRATGRRRRVVPVRLPGKVFRGYRRGGHLAPEHATGRITFEEYLAAHPDPAARSYRVTR